MSAPLHDRQAAAGRQGAEFEKAVEILLLCQNWTIQERHWREPTINVEIDFVATDPSGETWWIECKGSWESPTVNGLERTDTLKKAIGSAALLRLLDERKRYMVITSHLPRVGTAGEQWLQRAFEAYFDAVEVVGFGQGATQ